MTKLFSNRSKLSISALVAFAGVAAASSGCTASADETVKPRLDVINQTKSALEGTEITSIAGTYGAACTGRDPAGTETWTVTVSGPPATDELTIRKNDPDCVLTFANILTSSGTFIGSPAMALDTTDTFKETASAFATAGQPLAFYGNSKISALDFGTDFTITVLVSDLPNAADDGNKGASYLTQFGTVSAGTVPASDYTAAFGPLGVNVDATNEVLSVTGYAQLTAHFTTGQDWAIYEGALTGSTPIATIGTAYAAATAGGLVSDLTSLRIPATAFDLVSKDLDTTTRRTVIIRNTLEGVSSYELVLVTFTP